MTEHATEHVPQIPKELLTPGAGGAEGLHEVSCAECRHCAGSYRVRREELETFCVRVFEQRGVPHGEAVTTARVLVSADLRGVSSHGVARLGRYLTGLAAGYIRPGAEFAVDEPAPAIGVIDARHGIGQVVAEQAMDLAIAKARAHGVGLVTVRNSNHFGIAGYYVLRALEQRMLGLCMTNSAPLVVPTHGVRALLGTNPIAFGVPAARHRPFLLDMATSVVPRGRLEVYDRNRKQLPVGWAVDEKGFDCENPAVALRNLGERLGGGLLPLGGRGEELSGHKGYGLAAMVDVLCGVLSGSAFLAEVNDLKRSLPPGEIAAPRVGHFFLAADIGRFMPLDEFERRMDRFIDALKDSPKALDQTEILVHGEPEDRRAAEYERDGIPLSDNVMGTLVRIARESGLKAPACVDAAQG